MRVHRPIFFLSSTFLLATIAFAQALFVKPVKVLGDPHFIGTAGNPLLSTSAGPNGVEGRELNSPQGIALDTSVTPPIVYIADTGNNRVLAFRYETQLVPGAQADIILGQQDRFSNGPQGPGTSLTSGLRFPTGLVVDSNGNLYVADSGNNRIVRYPKPFSQPAGAYQFPDFIIGQTGFTAGSSNQGGTPKANTLSLFPGSFIGRAGLVFDASGNLWVADVGNNRVLRFPASTLRSGASFAPAADLAIGQPDLISSASTNNPIARNALARPTGINFDAAGNLYVADGAARVLVFPPNPGPAASAIRLLGILFVTQPPPPPINETGLNSASAIAAFGTSVVVTDPVSNRALIYTALPQWAPESTLFSPSAIGVIGQLTFNDGKANAGHGDASAATLSTPTDIAASGSELYIVDSGNNRVLVYPSGPSGPSQTAARVIGQLDFPYRATNLLEGKEFNFSGASGAASGSVVLDQSVSPPRLYVADTLNHRILGYANFNKVRNGDKPDLVIGQPDFSRNVINYPTGDSAQPNAQGLNGPTSLLLDSAGNLYVADTFNSRILRFPSPFDSGKTALQSADLVIGQSSFTSVFTDATERTMSAPVSLAFNSDGANASVNDKGWLLAADANHNRVLFFPKPFSSGMAASKILGQLNFTSTSTSADPQRMSSPRGVAIDPKDRPLVADFGNGRVQIFGPVQNLPDYATPSITLAGGSGLQGPLSISVMANGQFWVADASQNRVLHFPSIDQLPVKNYAADASVPVIGPRSVAVDPYNNLVVADGINRVLYYAPGLAAVNAASYLTNRPLARGTFAAIFPASTTPAAVPGTPGSTPPNVIAAGTESASSFPLATTLADTQVLVNGTPSSLFFVSPGQINLPLSLDLPGGGSVDVQAIRASTGQIYGGGEIQLTSASPGLFVIGGGQTGQAAALNEDSTVNSATNPVLRGHVIQLFGTGQGSVPGAPPDGQPGTGPLPTPSNPQILLGSAFVPEANIQYSGLAPALVGVWQINFQVPANAQTGTSVPISLLMNSIPSNNPSSPNQIVATISVK